MIIMEGYAKLNLCLAVTGTINGLHKIDSVFTQADIFDTVEISVNTGRENVVRYTDGRSYERDNALIMADLISKKFGTNGVDVVIEKRIPEARGLGGSSADAGAVARAMEKEFGLPKIPSELLLAVGSDVLYSYNGGDMRVKGVGDDVTRIELPNYFKAILIPKDGVSTAECYHRYDEIGGDNGSVDEFLAEIRQNRIPKCFNALQRAAETLNENVALGRELMLRAGFEGCMTGSGSTLFGIETDKQRFIYKTKRLKEYADERFSVYD